LEELAKSLAAKTKEFLEGTGSRNYEIPKGKKKSADGSLVIETA